MGLPQVQAGCVPMLETGINILNLPLISNFVNCKPLRANIRENGH